MAKTYLQPGKVLDWTNGSGSPVVSGEMVVIGTRLGVALDDIADTEVGAVQISGVWTLTKLITDDVAAGDVLNYDDSAAHLIAGATAAAGDLTGAAMAVSPAGTATTDVDVLLGNHGVAS